MSPLDSLCMYTPQECRDILAALERLLRPWAFMKDAYVLSNPNLAAIHPQFVAVVKRLRELFPRRFEAIKLQPPPRRGESGMFWREDIYYLRESIQFCVDLLAPALGNTSSPSVSISREGLFLEGQVFDAFLAIRDLIAVADRSIWIADAYVSEKLFDLFSFKKAHAIVSVLTREIPSGMRRLAAEFNSQYGGLNIRKSIAFHDRFVIVDDLEFFHFGASLKDAGKRLFMFSRIEEPTIVDRLREVWTRENESGIDLLSAV